MPAPRPRHEADVRRVIGSIGDAARAALAAPFAELLAACVRIADSPLDRGRPRGAVVAGALWQLGSACGRLEEVRRHLRAGAEACTAAATQLKQATSEGPEPLRIPDRIDRAAASARVSLLVREADDLRRVASKPTGQEDPRVVWAHPLARPSIIAGLGTVAADHPPELIREVFAEAAELAGEPQDRVCQIARSRTEPFRQAGRLARHRRAAGAPAPLLKDPFTAHLLTREAVDGIVGVATTPATQPARRRSLRQALGGRAGARRSF